MDDIQSKGELPPHLAWVRRVYAAARAATVRIETEYGTGSGFFFHSPRHIVTAYHVIEDAEIIVVVSTTGRRLKARVVAHDAPHDIVMLEVDEPIAPLVLEPYTGHIAVGMMVVAIGHPYSDLSRLEPRLRGLLDWSVVRGVVGAYSSDWIQVDASINPGQSGAPLLSPDGHVVGVISSRLREAEGLGFAIRVSHATALIPKIGEEPPPRAHVAYDATEIGWAIQVDGGTLMGLTGGAGVLFLRRFPLRSRISYLEGTNLPSNPSIAIRDVARISLELDVGVTLWVSALSITPQVGGSIRHDAQVDSRLPVVFVDEGCTTIGCPQEARLERDENDIWGVQPYLGGTLGLGLFRGSYAYQFGVGDLSPEHRIYFSLAF